MSFSSDVVRRLLKRATRAEAPVLEGLALAEGIFWRCRMSYCALVNDDTAQKCKKYGSDRKP